MKILGETRRILGFLGLLHDQSGISVKSLSHKISVFIFVALMPMSTLSYLLFGSMESNEFYECAYVFVSSSTVTGCFIVLWWDERRISLFLNELESAVTKSKIFFRENVQSFLITFNLDHILGLNLPLVQPIYDQIISSFEKRLKRVSKFMLFGFMPFLAIISLMDTFLSCFSGDTTWQLIFNIS